ncbi:nucleotidyltransferase domain-containing protein [Arthrobacter ginkgonis]
MPATAEGRNRFLRHLSRVIGRWELKPVQVTLFGSAARGTMRPDSDIDVLFILPDGASDELHEAIGDLAVDAYRVTGNDVRPLVYEMSEVRPADVLTSIVREGVHVYGDRHLLARVVGARKQRGPEARR